MKVIPVLDILNGEVVRGVAGRRQEYRRIVSKLTPSADPLEVARTFRDLFGFLEIYLADLDGIIHQRPNRAIYQSLYEAGFQLLVDAGIRDVDDAKALTKAGVTRLIVGLETCRSPDDLQQIVRITPDVTFSLDLFDGRPRQRNDSNGWCEQPNEIVRQAIHAGVNSVLPLDLSDVGTGSGVSTDSICLFIRDHFPEVQLIAGGGVRNRADLNRLKQLGVDGVLVASALHDGKLSRSDLT